MKFTFVNASNYVEALEYMLHLNIGFKHNSKEQTIKIDPIKFYEEPTYDAKVVNVLTALSVTEDDADNLLAMELKNNVAR